MAHWFDLSPSSWATALFAIGWVCGWTLLARPPRLVPADLPAEAWQVSAGARPPISVVIPARNEAELIGRVLAGVLQQLGADDEVIVVDDHSTDATAELARAQGATVVAAPVLPDGWAGKPHACAFGAAHVGTEPARVLVFLDADVDPGPGLLDALAAKVVAEPRALVTVQPWHRTERLIESASLLFNLAALMGSGACSVLGPTVAGRVAFGPVLACRRSRYDELGGHAHPDVRSAVLEDIALARRFETVDISVGVAGGTEFRMYPDGWRSLVQGWTKGMGIGLDATPWWAVLGVAAWMWSLAGGWLASPWFWVASVVQLLVLARVAGRFSPVAVLMYPVLTAAFVLIVVRSVVLRRLGRTVVWKDRRVRPDQATG